MSTDQTELDKTAVRRFAQAANTHDPQVISQTVDELFDVNWRPGWQMPIQANGLEDIKNVFATLHTGFPDLQINIEDLIAEGDKVVARERITGTHDGAYMGLAATGRKVAYNEITIARFVDGRIVETWGLVDLTTLMKQLGAIPPGPDGRPSPPLTNAPPAVRQPAHDEQS